MSTFDFVPVAGVAVICYLLGMGVKISPIDDKYKRRFTTKGRTNSLEEFKVGDKVKHHLWGNGTINEVVLGNLIHVLFSKMLSNAFTNRGHIVRNVCIHLYTAKPRRFLSPKYFRILLLQT